MNLYNIHSQLMEAIAELDDAEKLDAEDGRYLDEVIAELLKEKDDKFSNLCAFIKNLEAYETALKTEADVLYDKAKVVKNRIENVKKVIAHYLPPGEKWTNGVHTLGWRKSAALEPIPLDDGTIFIPEPYKRIKTVVEADKKAIGDAIKAGGEVTGWKLTEKNNLQVK